MKKNKRKLRILWCGEASFLNTGYAIYAKELLTRMYETDKYIIAELACYATADNPQINDSPWRIYPAMPCTQEEASIYASNQSYQFGEWRFEDVCLDFKPDVVIDIRDWWMIEYQERSPFRKFYHWAIMPTIDSCPQQKQYLNTYSNADAVFTYSDFGRDVLEEESNGHIRVVGVPSPGANFENLRPVTNKEQHRASFGFSENVNIVGTIMRNQKRKLYPNLIAAFRKMLDKNPSFEQNTYLYIHTSYPDLGWDIPYFIKKYNMSKHLLMTYKCRSCGFFFPSFYQDAKTSCPSCSDLNAFMPNTAFGVNQSELGSIINWFDLYVQYSVCEGFGMPQVEAASCAVPIITVDYSAMQSVGKKLKADFVGLSGMFWDAPTHSERAVPNDDELAEKMESFIKLPRTIKSKKGMDAYVGVKKHFTWDKCFKIWEKYLDQLEPRPLEETWDSEPEIKQGPSQIPPDNITNEEFVRWAVANVWGEKEKCGGNISLRLLKDLNYGKSMSFAANSIADENSFGSQTYVSFSKQDLVNKLDSLREQKNEAETKRHYVSVEGGWSSVQKPAFLEYVKPDEKNHKE